ncbi:HPP family protein [Pantoea sp. PNT01]|jgi:CBS domain-containing membrane protein|uniref:HPP family protein n=1 Tax=Pantoea TaxID=53335 RepID=UPI0001E0830C|nr:MULTISPECIES: HPP family protein [Pantoea]PQL30146.1 HPP family protein [Pantoea ananatis]AWP33025.1 HPP family protein [Pantoea vagans]EFM19255.1 HPP family protein [Pantoea sp. aB]MBD9551125.1 HPP family protein [Pantoea sp. PNT01]MCD2355927.1 HPP family protein [Pantoea sp. MHSD4]
MIKGSSAERHPLRLFLARFWPHPLTVSKKHVVIAGLGAGIGLVLTSLLSHWMLGELNLWFVAPVGASAVLLFGLPASPLAQPWAIVGGNTLSALAGVTVSQLIPDPAIACGVAACVAILLMFQLRCLHPPGGAVALTAILGGPSVDQLGYQFVLTPIMLNSLTLALLALLFNNLAGRRYPHPLAPQEVKPEPIAMPVSLTRADLHQALQGGELLDIDEDDLQELLLRAEEIAGRRQVNG